MPPRRKLRKRLPNTNQQNNIRSKSSPEKDSFKTIAVNATIEPLPRHLRSADVPNKKSTPTPVITRAASQKKPKPVNYDVIERANSPVNKAKRQELTETVSSVGSYKQEIQCQGNETIPSENINKENLNPNVNECIMNYVTIRNRVVENNQKKTVSKVKSNIKKQDKRVVKKAKSNSKISITNKELLELTDIKQTTVDNSNNNSFSSLMDSYIKATNKLPTINSKKQRIFTKNTSSAKNHKFVNFKTSPIDTVMRNADANNDYESIYSDEDVSKFLKRKYSGIPRPNNKEVSTLEEKLPSLRSSPFSDLLTEKENTKPKMIEVPLTDSTSESNTETINFLEARSSKSINQFPEANRYSLTRKEDKSNKSNSTDSIMQAPTVTLSRIAGSDDVTVDLTKVPDIEANILKQELESNFLQETINSEEPSLNDGQYNCDDSVINCLNIEAKNQEIHNWVATGVTQDVTLILKRNMEVMVQSYAVIIRTYLESLQGAVHPELADIYNMLIILDQEMHNYFNRKEFNTK